MKRFTRLATLGAALALGCGGGGTFVLVDIDGPANEPPISRIDLKLSLGGQMATTSLTPPTGTVALPTSVTLQINNGSGTLDITAEAINASGTLIDTGTATGNVQQGGSTTIVVHLGGGSHNDGSVGNPDLTGTNRDFTAGNPDLSVGNPDLTGTNPDLTPPPPDLTPPPDLNMLCPAVPCGAGMWCDTTTGQCNALVGLGGACTAQVQCTAGLTCLDGVCCGTAVCPQCMNCSATGSCDIVVGSAAGVADTSNNTCSGNKACDANGACKLTLGQACGANTDCVSGNCVDGFCCGVAQCPQCMNCSATGACDVTVKSADDNTGKACNMGFSCDAVGTCSQVWTQATIINGTTLGSWSYVAGMGSLIYFASSSGCNVTYFKSLDPASGSVVNLATTGSAIEACGFGGTLTPMSQVGLLCYFGNSGSCFNIARAAWGSETYPSADMRGEAAYAPLGSVLYQIGGRDINNVDQVTTNLFNPSTGGWSSTTNAPAANSQGCGGTAGTNLYTVGGRVGPHTYVFNTTSNTWASGPDMPNNDTCYDHFLPQWRGNLAVPGGAGVYVYNVSTSSWSAPIAYPPGSTTGQWQIAVINNGTDLYAMADFGGNIVVYKYTFM